MLTDVSFEVAEGETLVLLGPSGCGKTTLLKCLNRLLEPDGGTIELRGQDVRQLPPAQLRRGIGYAIQQVGLLPHLTVAQNVGVVPGLLGWPPARTAARVAELLGRLGLPATRFGPLRPAELSGGQQQRVGLARALAAEPPLVLLDEPFGALDPVTRAAVRRDFRQLPELRRTTVVLVTHDVPEAFELADRILLLDQGGLAQLGTPRELLRHPASAFVRDFLAADYLALALRVATLAELRPWLLPAAPPPPPTGTAEVSPALPPPVSATPESLYATPQPLDNAPEVLHATPQLPGTTSEILHDTSQSLGTTPEVLGATSQLLGDAAEALDAIPQLTDAVAEGLDVAPTAAAYAASRLPNAPAAPLPGHLSVQEALTRLTDAPGQRLPLPDAAGSITAGQVLAAFGQAMSTLFPALP